MIHANNAITLKCKSKYLFDEVEKPILFLPVIDGNLYSSLQIHESFERFKKYRTPYITLKIYNPSSEPYYFRKGTLMYNVSIVIPLESKRKTLHITEPNMKVKKKRQSRKLKLDFKFTLINLSPTKQRIVKKILNCQKEIFSWSVSDIGDIRYLEMEIELMDKVLVSEP